MSKTAYIVRHINFENAGILESVLTNRWFELTYIEAPLANFEHYDATAADLVIVCGAPIGAYDEELYPFLTAIARHLFRRSTHFPYHGWSRRTYEAW